MPNLIEDGDLWLDISTGDIPPAYWTGSIFSLDQSITPQEINMRLIDESHGDDVISATVGITREGGNVTPITFRLINTSTSEIYQQVAIAPGTPANVLWNVPSFAPVAVFASFDPGEGDGNYVFTITPVAVPAVVSYNCECDDDYPRKTLLQMRTYLLTRLGYAAQLASPPPGMVELLNSFIVDAQEQIYRQYKVFRMERFFTWQLLSGVRFYDLPDNEDVCTKKLDPRMVNWVGISQIATDGNGDDIGGNFWRPLVCGIKPEYYYADITSIPTHYEIRQCIEIWPPPSDDTYKLRVKGYYGVLPLVIDTDESSIDYEAIQLFALANAKAHYGQPDAANYMQQYRGYIAGVTAGSHHTRRYVPATDEWIAPSLPVFTGYSGN